MSVLGIVIKFSDVQFAKAPCKLLLYDSLSAPPIICNWEFCSNCIDSKLKQFIKAPLLIVFTFAGISIEINDLQLENANSPIVLRFVFCPRYCC